MHYGLAFDYVLGRTGGFANLLRQEVRPATVEK
jgi:hypothetical protein